MRFGLLQTISVSAFLLVAQACASLSFKDGAQASNNTPEDSGIGFGIVDGSSSDASHPREAGIVLNPLCGVGSCGESQPDDRFACRGAKTDAGPHGVGPDGGGPDASVHETKDGGTVDGGRADAAREAGVAPSGSDGSAAPPKGELDASPNPSTGGSAGSPPPYTPIPEEDAGPRLACQVHAVDNGDPVHECLPAGPGDIDDPCSGGDDCRAGLACVGVAGEASGSGLCQPYCCAKNCAPVVGADGGVRPTFCTDRPLIQGKGAAPLLVPVCVRTVGCLLEEPYPCPEGATCRCQADLACAVVDPALGSTSCVKPGKGRLGDPCRRTPAPEIPCAWGYFCSAAGTCLKQCQPGSKEDTCHPGKCQAAAGLPDGWGLCEGLTPLAR